MRVEKLCVLVVGPESCGNRLAARLLAAAGCYGRPAAGPQPFDDGIPPAHVHPLAMWLRSIPHNRHWPDIRKMVTDLRIAGYAVKAVVTTRNWLCAAASQVRAGHVSNEQEALHNLRTAYPFIFSHLKEADVAYTMLHYDALVAAPKITAERLMVELGLTMQSMPEIYDGNEKWYRAQGKAA